MKFFTSSFYNIRFFKPYQIPVSTALWDPKWYHNGEGPGKVWVNEQGVWLGLRAACFSPSWCPSGCCPCKEHNPGECTFIKTYEEGLRKLDFNEILETLTGMATYIKDQTGFVEEPEIVLIVYEAENNPCSERNSIQRLFMANGIEITEWKKD